MSEATKRTYKEHLEDLYRFYGPDLADLPTPDNILNAVCVPDENITFDQRDALIACCLHELSILFKKYGSDKLNVVTMEKMNHFLDWVITFPIELQISTLRSILAYHQFPFEDKHGRRPDRWKDMSSSLIGFMPHNLIN